jgi:hypothetical protein
MSPEFSPNKRATTRLSANALAYPVCFQGGILRDHAKETRKGKTGQDGTFDTEKLNSISRIVVHLPD